MSDIERPLNDRGERTAPFMGTIMSEREFIPQSIISSPAVRARQTAELVTEAAGFEAKLTFDERIYEASPLRLLAVISDIPADIAVAMLVGHNPGLEGLIWYLTGKLEPMPTCTLAVIELDVEKWEDAAEGCGSVTDILRPKDLLDATR